MRLRRLWRNPWFRGIMIGILGILVGNFLIPFLEFTFRPSSVDIVYPVDGEAVYWLEDGSTVIGNYWKLQDNRIYTLIHPTGTDYWYVQPMPTLVDESILRGRVCYGTGPEGEELFEIQALMTKTELVAGDMYTLQEMHLLRDESAAKSVVATVTKLATRHTPIMKEYTRECEDPDEYSVGQTAQRTNASELKVHGQFGCETFDPWTARAGYVEYNIPELCSDCPIYLVLGYSKSSPSSAPIMIHLDDETQPRAVFTPNNQESWNEFTETDLIDLGQIGAGAHTIKFVTDGQQHGVADLDKFTLYYCSE
jgi:hypothetical protein